MTELEKEEAITGFIELVSKNIIEFYTMMGLKSHMTATLVNEATGEVFDFSFKKVSPNKQEDGTQGTPLQQG